MGSGACRVVGLRAGGPLPLENVGESVRGLQGRAVVIGEARTASCAGGCAFAVCSDDGCGRTDPVAGCTGADGSKLEGSSSCQFASPNGDPGDQHVGAKRHVVHDVQPPEPGGSGERDYVRDRIQAQVG